jgi:hypothetical protein
MSNNNHQRNLPVPFFSQREVTYRWQRIANGEEVNAQGRKGEDITVADSANGIVAKFYFEGEEMGKPVSLPFATCNIVSLCMILHYYGITDDSPDKMIGKFFTTIFPGSTYDFRHEWCATAG